MASFKQEIKIFKINCSKKNISPKCQKEHGKSQVILSHLNEK